MSTSKPQDQDALALLQLDHAQLKSLFRQFEALGKGEDQDERKSELIDDICYLLTIHAMVEEELFYPTLRASLDIDELLDQAEAEHAGAKDLIGQLEIMFPGDEHYEATVAVLSEEVERHFELEESEIFRQARLGGIDLKRLGTQILERKQELADDPIAPPAPIDPPERATGPGRRSGRAPN
jgi:hemerythrin-like domain-containing protein